MKAWQFHGTHKPFERVDVAAPTIEPDKVIIDVKAAGLCHSDVGILEDEKWLENMVVPVIPGHETAGVIAEVGENVTDWKVGERVAVWPLAELQGYMVNGAWAAQTIVSTEALVAIPEGVSFEEAAAATDAGMTSSGAVLGTGGVTAGMKVGIIGFGGLGQIGGRLAVLNGAELYVAEINEDVWPAAKEAGATKVAKSITAFKDEELDVIVDFAGFGVTTAEAVETVKFNGRVVQVGMAKLEANINTYALILGKVQLLGSMGGTKDDIAEVMKWIASGDLNPTISRIGFEDIAEGVDSLKRGEVQGRLVAMVEE